MCRNLPILLHYSPPNHCMSSCSQGKTHTEHEHTRTVTTDGPTTGCRQTPANGCYGVPLSNLFTTSTEQIYTSNRSEHAPCVNLLFFFWFFFLKQCPLSPSPYYPHKIINNRSNNKSVSVYGKYNSHMVHDHVLPYNTLPCALSCSKRQSPTTMRHRATRTHAVRELPHPNPRYRTHGPLHRWCENPCSCHTRARQPCPLPIPGNGDN